jgi:purine-binding chemotaxis protein CheW
MGGRACAIACEHVVEIIPRVLLSQVPNAPPGVLGVINLRGKVVPVVDVRARIAGTTELSAYQHLVIVTGSSRLIGVAVDDVHDVVTVPAAAIENPGELGDARGPGIARIGDELVLVLGPDDLQAKARDDGAAPGKRGP